MATRYERAISRNLAELQWALIHRTTIQGLAEARPLYSYFNKSVYTGLFNDYIAHAIKVFEDRKRVSSFWYIVRTDGKVAHLAAKEHSVDMQQLERVSRKLKHIRDKTHFHIDEEGVLDPKQVWREADLSKSELAHAIDDAWNMLTYIQAVVGVPAISVPPTYTINVARDAARRAEGT